MLLGIGTAGVALALPTAFLGERAGTARRLAVPAETAPTLIHVTPRAADRFDVAQPPSRAVARPPVPPASPPQPRRAAAQPRPQPPRPAAQPRPEPVRPRTSQVVFERPEPAAPPPVLVGSTEQVEPGAIRAALVQAAPERAPDAPTPVKPKPKHKSTSMPRSTSKATPELQPKPGPKAEPNPKPKAEPKPKAAPKPKPGPAAEPAPALVQAAPPTAAPRTPEADKPEKEKPAKQ